MNNSLLSVIISNDKIRLVISLDLWEISLTRNVALSANLRMKNSRDHQMKNSSYIWT